MNTSVQHVVDRVEVEKIPLQFTDKVIDVVAQRQIRVNRNVQKTIEISQLQYTDDVVDVPVVLVVQAPLVQVMAETAEIPQLQITDKVVDVPVVLVVPVSQVRVVKKTVEDPQFQIVEKTAEAPQTQTIQVTQTSESLGIECDEGHELMLQGNDSVSVAKDVEDEANEVSEKSPDCMVCSSASGSKRQRHNCNQQHGPGQAVQQTVQERRVERGKEKQRRKRKMLGRKERRNREREREKDGREGRKERN